MCMCSSNEHNHDISMDSQLRCFFFNGLNHLFLNYLMNSSEHLPKHSCEIYHPILNSPLKSWGKIYILKNHSNCSLILYYKSSLIIMKSNKLCQYMYIYVYTYIIITEHQLDLYLCTCTCKHMGNLFTVMSKGYSSGQQIHG